MIHLIKNITKGKWVNIDNGRVTSGQYKKATVFFEEDDANATLEMLNDTKQDCFTLIPITETDDTLNNQLN